MASTEYGIRRIEALTPVALCDTCRLDPALQPTCLVCDGSGALNREQMKERKP